MMAEAFLKIAQLAGALNVRDINKLDGCWEHQVDERWWIALNGHSEMRLSSDGGEIAPFTAYIKYNGWPAGVIDPRGGVIAAGECANERTFIEALEAAARSAQGKAVE
jgi:hypothetical protein